MSSFLPVSSSRHTTQFSAVVPFAIEACHHLKLAISTTDRGLAGVEYVEDSRLQGPDSTFAEEVVSQLERYFDDPQWRFDLPLDVSGTSFQKRLWHSLCTIPVGQTNTYGHLASVLQSGAQAVGQACRRNPVPVVVPCHRIVSRQGLGGYAGEVDGEKMRIKKALLAHEGHLFD